MTGCSNRKMPELAVNWIGLWGCVALRRWCRIEEEPTGKGCLNIAALFYGIILWLRVVGDTAEIVNGVFYFIWSCRVT